MRSNRTELVGLAVQTVPIKRSAETSVAECGWHEGRLSGHQRCAMEAVGGCLSQEE